MIQKKIGNMMVIYNEEVNDKFRDATLHLVCDSYQIFDREKLEKTILKKLN